MPTAIPSFAGRLLRLLPVPAVAMLAAACDGSSLPQEPPIVEEGVAASQDPLTPVRDPGRWADGYLLADQAQPFYTPSQLTSFNRAGGPITITKPTGTTGRYIAAFSGLSAVLGSTSTLHVTSHGNLYENTYCKSVDPAVVRDKVEVRCYHAGTGAAVNENFTLLVTRNYPDVAFAYAHRPTSTNYSPRARGSWNPAGTTTVSRDGVGQYFVVFYELGRQLTNNNGHWQVNAVGSNKVYCKLSSSGSNGHEMFVRVRCYTPDGNPADSKFTVLFVLPAAHLAYTYADQPSAAIYAPDPFDSSNPAGGAVSIERSSPGLYYLTWEGVNPAIVDLGNVQVTAEGSDNVQCKVWLWGTFTAYVTCLNSNNAPVDSRFTVLFGS
jgi:hypothetical protein